VWLSDTLCRLTTGGGFATRRLYTDQDETLFDAARSFSMASRPSSTGDARGERPKCSHEHEVVDHTSCSKTVDSDELVVAVKPGVTCQIWLPGPGTNVNVAPSAAVPKPKNRSESCPAVSPG